MNNDTDTLKAIEQNTEATKQVCATISLIFLVPLFFGFVGLFLFFGFCLLCMLT